MSACPNLMFAAHCMNMSFLFCKINGTKVPSCIVILLVNAYCSHDGHNAEEEILSPFLVQEDTERNWTNCSL